MLKDEIEKISIKKRVQKTTRINESEATKPVTQVMRWT